MKKLLKTFIYGFLSLAILLFIYKQLDTLGASTEISYTEFMEMTEHGDIEKVVIDGDYLKIYPYDSKDYYTTEYIDNSEFVNYLTEQEVIVTKETTEESGAFSIIFSLILSFLPMILLFWLFSKMMSNIGGGDNSGGNPVQNIFNTGKNKSKMYKENDTGVKFSDVAGQEEAKESLVEIIDYLHNADKYKSIGAKMPKGALLVGPPGTGKTLLAKAVAGEAGVPFFSLTGSDFVEMFVGVGASRVRDLFEEAKKNSPCIIFIDEIDAIGKSRGSGANASGHDEREQTLNQLLSEMDGFDSNNAIVVLAATNRPEILDKALLRPGRFDRRVIVDRPDLKGREDILNVHIKDVRIDETVNLKSIAQATAGAVGADLANIINEAALRAVKFGRNAVSQEDLMESVEVVFAGKEKKDRIMSEKERKIVAYHEVGHAVIAALQKNAAPVQKITIVPRTMGSLGYTMQVPEEERYLSSKTEMLEEIKTLIGGRCTEEVFFDIITTGASNDIEKVTDLAKKMITIYGMSDTFDMVAFETIGNYYLDDTRTRNCSEEFSAIIDKEIVHIVKQCHDEVRQLIESNKDLIDEVAAYLLEKENITGEEFMTIFRKYHDGPNPTPPKKETSSKLFSSKIETKEEVPSKNNAEENKNSIVEEVIEPLVDVPPLDENTFEEPLPMDDMLDIDMEIEPTIEPKETSSPDDEIPMPEFDFPFAEETSNKNEEKTETKSSQKDEFKESESNNVQKEEKTEIPKEKPAFEAPKPLQKKKKKKTGSNSTQNKQSTQEKPSDLEALMKSVKTNPQELAQKKKKGIYVDDKQKTENTKKSNVLNPDSKPSDVTSNQKDEVTEDDY